MPVCPRLYQSAALAPTLVALLHPRRLGARNLAASSLLAPNLLAPNLMRPKLPPRLPARTLIAGNRMALATRALSAIRALSSTRALSSPLAPMQLEVPAESVLPVLLVGRLVLGRVLAAMLLAAVRLVAVRKMTGAGACPFSASICVALSRPILRCVPRCVCVPLCAHVRATIFIVTRFHMCIT